MIIKGSKVITSAGVIDDTINQITYLINIQFI
jgi:hypothetical protein